MLATPDVHQDGKRDNERKHLVKHMINKDDGSHRLKGTVDRNAHSIYL